MNGSAKKTKIALVVGGLSSEREVSFKTGESFAKALDELQMDYITIEANDDLPSQLQDLRPGVVLNALHGKWAEDGVVQGVCEYLKIPYTGCGVLASAIGMDKAIAKQIWERNGIQTAKGYVIKLKDAKEDLSQLQPEIEFPLVVKPSRDGSSVGISICQSKEDWQKALESASRYDQELIVESYIPGDEVCVAIFEDKSFTPIEIVPKEGYYDYESKYTSGKTEYFLPARLPEDVLSQLKKVALESYHCIGGRSYARVDFRVKDKKDIYILEINTLPGCTETSLVPKSVAHEGIGFTEFVRRLIMTARLDYENVD